MFIAPTGPCFTAEEREEEKFIARSKKDKDFKKKA